MPHVDRLFRHAMWLEQNRAAAEDLVQDTLVQALQSFDRYTPDTHCRAWLVAILHNVRANRLRKLGRMPIDRPTTTAWTSCRSCRRSRRS